MAIDAAAQEASPVTLAARPGARMRRPEVKLEYQWPGHRPLGRQYRTNGPASDAAASVLMGAKGKVGV
jgi:hypothetical protein